MCRKRGEGSQFSDEARKPWPRLDENDWADGEEKFASCLEPTARVGQFARHSVELA